MTSLVEDVRTFYNLLPKESNVSEDEDVKEIDQNLETFSNQFISKYFDSRHDVEFSSTMSKHVDEDFITYFLDSRRYTESETFLKLSIILCSLQREIVMALRNEGSIAEILMAMDSSVETPTLMQLGAYALILSSAYPVESEYLEEMMISHICDIMKSYNDNDKTLHGLCIALSNLCYGRDDVKMFVLKHNAHDIVMKACKTLKSENLYKSAVALIRNLTTHKELSSHDYTSSFYEFICHALDVHKENHQIALNGLWTFLNLIKESLHNKIAFVHNFQGLNCIKTMLEEYKGHEDIVEICFILLQQLCKASKNRGEVRRSGIFDLVLDVEKIHKDSLLIVKPFIMFMYRFSFNKENRSLIGKKGIKHILRPLKKDMPSEQVHIFIAKLILKLSEEPKNKEVIKNEDGIGSLVSSLNFYPDKSRITNYTTRAMNEIFKSAKSILPSSSSSDSDSSSDEADSDEAFDVEDPVLIDPSKIEADIPSLDYDDQSNSTNEIMEELDQIMNDLDPMDDVSKIKDQKTEISLLKKMLQQVRHELEEEKQRYELMSEEKDNEISDLQQTSLSLAEQLESVSSKSELEIKGLKEQLEALKANQTDYELMKKELDNFKRESAHKESMHKESIESLKSQLNGLIEEQEKNKEELENSKIKEAQYNSQMEALESTLKEKEEFIENLNGKENNESKIQAESLLKDISVLEDVPDNLHSHMCRLYEDIKNRESDPYEIFARYLSNSILNLKLFAELEKMRKYL